MKTEKRIVEHCFFFLILSSIELFLCFTLFGWMLAMGRNPVVAIWFNRPEEG